MRARCSGGFRSPLTRAEENNAKEQHGNHDRIRDTDPTRPAPSRQPAARSERRPHHHARADRSRRPLRPPDQALEPEDEAVHLRRAQRHPHHRPAADGPRCSSAPSTSWSQTVAAGPIGAVRRHQEAGAGRDPRRGGARRPVLRHQPLAGRHAHQLPAPSRARIERLRAHREDGRGRHATSADQEGGARHHAASARSWRSRSAASRT